MTKKNVLCFGEIVWDCLPQGIFLGGAPLNVAAHLHRQGLESEIVSAVGRDFLGQEAVHRIQELGVGTSHLHKLPYAATGTVKATLDENGNARYLIRGDSAWDHIPMTAELSEAAACADAFVFGSLAARSLHNMATLEALLHNVKPLKVFDVNMRPPFDARHTILRLAKKADILKLNEEELLRLLKVEHCGDEADAILRLSELTGVKVIVVTLGPKGAMALSGGEVIQVPSTPVEVRDTIGAGDAFMATLVEGFLCERGIETTLVRACKMGAYVASKEGAIPDYAVEKVLG